MRARQKKYEQSEKGKQCHNRYMASAKGKAVARAFEDRFIEEHGLSSGRYYRRGFHIINRALSSPAERIDGGTF